MTEVRLERHTLVTADGTGLAVTDALVPSSATRGSVVLMHGLGEHSGRYRHIIAFFNGLGFSVRSFDLRGHGRSQGARGDVPNGTPLLVDAEMLIDEFANRFDAPPFLFGHSMGGLFATQFALRGRCKLSGLILSSPALALDLSGFQRLLLASMLKLAPWLGVPNGLRPQYLSHDAEVVRAYRQDPLVHNKISARLLQSMLVAIDECMAKAADLRIPTCMIVAGDDHLVNAEGSHCFFGKLQHGVAEMHVYESCYHEVFNEPEAPIAFQDLRRWIEA